MNQHILPLTATRKRSLYEINLSKMIGLSKSFSSGLVIICEHWEGGSHTRYFAHGNCKEEETDERIIVKKNGTKYERK